MSVIKPSGTGRDQPTVKSSALDLKDLVVAYAKQETIDPLRALGRYLLWGLLGTVMISVGTVVGAVAVVRVVQTETGGHLGGNLSFIPYLGGIAFVALFVAVALLRIRGGR